MSDTQIYLPPEPECQEENVGLMTVPHNREAEEAVVGSVLINPSCYFEVSRILQPDDFYTHRLRWIWEAMQMLVNSRVEIDYLTLCDALERTGQLSEMGGDAYITSLLHSVTNSLNAEHYAEIVRGYSERRRGIALANQTAQDACNLDAEFSIGEHAIRFAAESRGGSRRVTANGAASRMIDMMNNPRVLSSGIIDVDRRIGGLFVGELSVLAGYQGSGKSAEKIQAARKNAEAGMRVMLCDLEMDAAQTWFRMACGDLGVDMNQVRAGKVSTEKRGEIMRYASELGGKYQGKITIYESPMTPSDILSAAMIEQPDIVYVDVLKNMAGKPGRESMQGWYDFVLNFLRLNVAKTCKCHVQVLHHLNRSTFREGRKPSMHDLMFAGESDSDEVFLLWRKTEDYGKVDAFGQPAKIVPITWITEKSRFGWTGDSEVNFDLPHQKFYGMEREPQAATLGKEFEDA